MCFGCHGLGCASGEDAFWPRNRAFWLLLDSEWLSPGDPWQSRTLTERADRVVLPVAYGNAAFGTGRPRNAAWSPGERCLGPVSDRDRRSAGRGSIATGRRARVYRVGPPVEGLWPPSEGGGARIELTRFGYACDLRSPRSEGRSLRPAGLYLRYLGIPEADWLLSKINPRISDLGDFT